ncbi:Hypothetical protein Mbur_2428 [Methanococcoides burtonii DSM 6242]|uniref:S-layer family duplication domain-containing protein n=2 Tax=Methanococcoides burtonii TaxID=29291 RepID=Q12TE7_METBU|nr:Hypothetical protein Mbur_2428 [Methanococcoides burtonii DSM 6242]
MWHVNKRVLRHLLSILLLFLIFFIYVCPVSAVKDDVLMDGKGIFIETKGEWHFSQGYLFVVKDVSDDGNVWVELLLDGVLLKDEILNEGSVFIYLHNSKEIFNITLDSVYYGSDGDLITFIPVYQYLDPSLPAPALNDSNVSSNSSSNVSNDPLENNSAPENNIPGFSFIMAILSMSSIVIFKRFS